MLPLDGVVLAYGVHLPQLALDMEPVRHHLLLQSPSSTFKPSLTFGQTMQLSHHGGGVRVQGDLGLGGAVSLHLGGQSSPRFLTWYCSYRSLARIQQEDFSLLLPDQRRLKLLSSG